MSWHDEVLHACPVITVIALCVVALTRVVLGIVRLTRYLMRAFRPEKNHKS